MSAPDLHPEELLDKAVRGTLTEQEASWLAAHLSQCAVCRFERAAAADFQAVAGGEGDVDVDDLVTRALSGQKSVAQPRNSSSTRRGMSALAAAAVMLFGMGSFAAVAQATGLLPRIIAKVSSLTQPTLPVPAPRPPRAPSPLEVEVPATPKIPQPEVEAPEALAAAAPAAPAAKPAPVVAVPVVQRAPVDAGALLNEATALRIRGDRSGAAQAYQAVLSRFPTSAEAGFSRVALGRLLFDSGDFEGALEQFDAYVRSGDLSLREEVLALRASALGQLGRADDERSAWRVLLENYPASVHASRARARLSESDTQ